MTAVLEIAGLRKTYRSRRRGVRHALDGFDMTVGAGQVHGFLGPNGSGKTTTLRTLLGLIEPDGGRMALFGQEVPAALPQVIGQVGAVVESPHFFGNFSARDTLSLLAGAGDVPQRRVTEVLELVGLRDRSKDRVKTFSLGMKQRLAVASALLKEPKLMILDEPANGLDPSGIREMRSLMRDLADSGMTVLFSSHILGEVQLICDEVTIISLGRRVAAGPVHEVLAAHSGNALRVRLEAVTDLPARGRDAHRRRPAGHRPPRPPADQRRRQAGRGHPGAGRTPALGQRADTARGRPGERLPGADRHHAGARPASPGRPVRGRRGRAGGQYRHP